MEQFCPLNISIFENWRIIRKEIFDYCPSRVGDVQVFVNIRVTLVPFSSHFPYLCLIFFANFAEKCFANSAKMSERERERERENKLILASKI